MTNAAAQQQAEKASQTIGPLVVVEQGNSLAIHGFNSALCKPNGVPLSVGSTTLRFWPRRSGAGRGQKVQYGPIRDEDRALVQLFAAAPDLLAACIAARPHLAGAIAAGELPRGESDAHFGDRRALNALDAAIAKAGGAA